MHRMRPRTIAAVFVGLTVVISAVIIIATLAQRADHAEQRADSAESEVADTRAELFMAEQTLDATQGELDVVEADIQEVTRSAERATEVSDRLSGRDEACRFVVKVSDKLLDTSIAYGKTADRMMKDQNGRASDSMREAGGHLGRVNKLIKQSGYATISDLFDACTPDIDREIAASRSEGQ